MKKKTGKISQSEYRTGEAARVHAAQRSENDFLFCFVGHDCRLLYPFCVFSMFFFLPFVSVFLLLFSSMVAPTVVVVVVVIFCLLVASLSACIIDAINLNSLSYHRVFENER